MKKLSLECLDRKTAKTRTQTVKETWTCLKLRIILDFSLFSLIMDWMGFGYLILFVYLNYRLNITFSLSHANTRTCDVQDLTTS